MILIPPETRPVICRDCDQPGIVGLGKSWFCPACFEIELREAIARIDTAIARANLSLPTYGARPPRGIISDAAQRIGRAIDGSPK